MQQVPLWRTCRVLANRVRLKMLRLLRRRPGLRVSENARAMTISAPATSQYLRALEACGFVAARRVRRSVVYDVRTDKTDAELTKAVMIRLGQEKNSVEPIFRLATAFANPGRIEVFRSLTAGPKSVAELKLETGWTRWTLLRHLQKLENRGFVSHRSRGQYETAHLTDALARALGDLAARDIA